MSDIYDGVSVNRLQATPDQDQRLERPSHHFDRPRMMKPWIAAAVLVAMLVTFIVLVVLDSGSSNNPAPPPEGGTAALSTVAQP